MFGCFLHYLFFLVFVFILFPRKQIYRRLGHLILSGHTGSGASCAPRTIAVVLFFHLIYCHPVSVSLTVVQLNSLLSTHQDSASTALIAADVHNGEGVPACRTLTSNKGHYPKVPPGLWVWHTHGAINTGKVTRFLKMHGLKFNWCSMNICRVYGLDTAIQSKRITKRT